jgi:signal transduction histidine kinase
VAAQNTSPAREPGIEGLWLGLLVYRWVTIVWMTTLAALSRADLRRPVLAIVAILVTVGWNLWFTARNGWTRPVDRWFDLGLSFVLLPVSGLVMPDDTAAGGSPFFAVSYPAASALTFGVAEGVGRGLTAAAVLSVGLLLSRLTNSTTPSEMTPDSWANLVNGIVYYAAAGAATGTVSRALRRSASERDEAIEEAARQRERAARLAERDALGRRIHDSVLQSLALIAKHGRQLAERSSVTASEVQELVGMAATQERALRGLLTEAPSAPLEGAAPLRPALQHAASGITAVPVSVTTTGDPILPTADLDELAAAVRQALENVVRHAEARSVTIFGEGDDRAVTVSVRDDGVGFDYDEARFAEEGKLGILHSMKGRIEALGGEMHARTGPGRGTEIEFRLPRNGTSVDG